MKYFDHVSASTLQEAADLLRSSQGTAKAMAGCTDLLGVLKDRILPQYPETVVNLKTIEGLDYIKQDYQGLKVGALTKLTAIAESDLIRDKCSSLAQAAYSVATLLIRNLATIGGNLCQDVRCWYYRYGLNCYRAGGNTCYADTPVAMNREHALFGADRCVAVSPSDTAPALVALDASMVIRSSKGERVVKAEDFFIGPRLCQNVGSSNHEV